MRFFFKESTQEHSTMKQIVIADNQDLTYNGWLFLLKSINNDHQVIRVRNKKELLHILHQQLVDIVIIDYSMFDFEQVNELLILEEKYKITQWLIAGDDLSDDFMRQVLLATSAISRISFFMYTPVGNISFDT